MKRKKLLFLITCFAFLLLSYYSNFFGVISEDKFENYDLYSEGLIFGKIVKSEREGIFSYAGFTGVYFQPDSSVSMPFYPKNSHIRDSIVNIAQELQLKYYLNNETTPSGYCPYLTHTGGNAIFYSVVNAVLPFDSNVKYHLFRFINALLVALCFVLFLGWAYRNYGLIASSIVFLLLFFSPWLLMFCGRNGLWWSLWSFYAPFLTMLLMLEKRHLYPERIKNYHIFIALFFGVFIKFMFTGFEFISSSLLAIYCPVIYYFLIEKKRFLSFVNFSFQSGLVVLASVLLTSLILVFQLKYVMGDFTSAFQYLADSYERRTVFGGSSLLSIILMYFGGNSFNLSIVSFDKFYFIYPIFCIFVSSIWLYFVSCKSDFTKKSYRALIYTTCFSVLCPLSWFVIFKEHAFGHRHLDYIVWYMPFLLFGFLVLGVTVSQLYLRLKNLKSK